MSNLNGGEVAGVTDLYVFFTCPTYYILNILYLLNNNTHITEAMTFIVKDMRSKNEKRKKLK